MGGRPAQPGLREHKKQLTRARLIDAAIRLLDQHGYEHTTVEKIAGAVHVSPRTVSHYFPSKDRLLLAPVDDYLKAVCHHLGAIPPRIPALQALLAANLAVLDDTALVGIPITAPRLATLLRALHSTPALLQLARSMRSAELTADLARRLGTTPEDRRVHLALSVWVTIMMTAFSGAADVHRDGDPAMADLPGLLRTRLTETAAVFASVAGSSALLAQTGSAVGTHR